MERRFSSEETNEMLTKSVKLENFEVNGLKISGYASVFNGVDAVGDTILPGAFEDALKVGMPKMFFNHDQWGVPIGKWTNAYEDEKGLYVEGELTEGNSTAEEVKAALQHGTVDGLSIGFTMKRDGFTYDDKTDTRLIKKISRLYEVSVVTFPCDDNARINEVKMEDIEGIKSERDLEKVLRDSGLSRNQALAFCAKARDVFISLRESEQTASEIQQKVESIKDLLKNIEGSK